MEVPVQQPVQQPVPTQPQTPSVPSPTPEPSPAPKRPFIIAFVVIVLVIIFGVVVYLMRGPSSTTVTPSTSVDMSPGAMEGDKMMETGSGLPEGTSDSQLEQDVQSIETSLEEAGKELVGVEEGLNDQSVDLSE
jgi:hypothetical protein